MPVSRNVISIVVITSRETVGICSKSTPFAMSVHRQRLSKLARIYGKNMYSFLRGPCQLSLFKCDVKTCLFHGEYCDKYVCLLNM